MHYSRGGMLENPPFVVPVQVSRELEELIPMFTGVVLDIVTNTANKNQVRGLFKQLLETNDKVLGDLVQTTADLCEYYIYRDDIPPSRVKPLLIEVGQLAVNGFLALAIQQYPGEFERYLDQAMVDDMRNYQRDLDMAISEARRGAGGGGGVQRFGGGGMSSGRSWQPGGGRGSYTGGGRGSRWDEEVPEQASYQRPDRFGSQERFGSGGGRMGSFGRGGTPSRSSGRSSMWDESIRPSTNAAEDNGSRRGVRPARDFGQSNDRQSHGTHAEPRRHVEPTNPNATIVGDITFVPLPDSGREWPKVQNVQRPWDRILMEDGRQLRPAHQSDWKVTFNPEQPLTPFYDPQTNVLFHILSADGKTVIEEPIKRNDTMNYLDHELDPKLRLKAENELKQKDGKVQMAWKLVENLAPKPESPLATDDVIDADKNAPALVAPAQHMLTVSLPDAIKKAGVMRKLEKADAMERPFELYADRAVLTTVVNPDFTALFELTNADSFRKAYQLLTDLPAGEMQKEVNKRLTAGVNHALSRNIGLKDWSIDSFEDDIGDLLKVLGEDYGPKLVEALEVNAVEIISRSLCHFSRKELDEPAVKRLLELPEDADATVLVWRERASITHLPVSSQDLVVPKNDGVLVSEANTPEFHSTIASVFNRTPDMPHVYYRRYLATDDGVVYELVRGYIVEAAHMLFKAEFNL